MQHASPRKTDHARDDTCACGKNDTPEAHGLSVNAKGTVIHEALSCDEVEATRQRVARDITRESMGRIERFRTWIQGRGDEYTADSYEAAWVAASSTRTDGAAR